MTATRVGRAAVEAAMLLVVAVSCAPQGRWAETAPAGLEQYVSSTRAEVVDCGSPDFCVALPASAAADEGLAWDGTSWREFPPPWGTGAVDRRSDLGALSCTGSWCLSLVVEPDGSVEAWKWDGSLPHWYYVGELPPSPGGPVRGVDCVDPEWCLAVGGSSVLRWTGAGWTAFADLPGPAVNGSVQCEARSSCFVLTPVEGDAGHGRIVHWDGVRWAPVAPVTGVAGSLGELACGPGGPCAYAGRELLSWSAGAWTAAPDGVVGDPHVACAADHSCVATYGQDTLSFDGSRWQRRSAPPTGPSPVRDLACASIGVCYFTLAGGTANDVAQSLLRWDGSSWTSDAVPSEVHVTKTTFANVDCPTDTWCMAVGTHDRREPGLPTGPRTTAQRWDGSSWSPAGDLPWHLLPNESQPFACSAVDRCLAGDMRRDRADEATPLLARWDGTRWTGVTGIEPSAPLTGIADIDCNLSVCAVVGLTADDGTVILVSAGEAWTELPPSPSSKPNVGVFFGVDSTRISCATARFCGTSGPSGASVWNGTTWSLPLLWGTHQGQLHVILATRPSCPAVGTCVTAYNLGTDSTALGSFATWNGLTWVTQRVPGHVGPAVCGAPDRCLAVGGTVGSPTTTWVRAGAPWRPVATAPAVPAGTALAALSCSPGGCMVVGATTDRAVAHRWSF